MLLSIPDFDASALEPWIEREGLTREQITALAAQRAEERQKNLTGWGIQLAQLERFHQTTDVHVFTPGSLQGEPLHILSSLERRKELWDTDPETARASLSAAISLVLRLLGRDPGEVLEQLHSAKWLAPKFQKLGVAAMLTKALDGDQPLLRETRAAALLEFGRVVHAEMNALADAARRGVAVSGATLFCTTFPCHICARHILAAGIRRVVYVEPYPKSLAVDLMPEASA